MGEKINDILERKRMTGAWDRRPAWTTSKQTLTLKERFVFAAVVVAYLLVFGGLVLVAVKLQPQVKGVDTDLAYSICQEECTSREIGQYVCDQICNNLLDLED